MGWKNIHIFYILHVICLFSIFDTTECSHFRGGILMWKPTKNNTEVIITFRMAWRMSATEGCNQTTIAQHVLIANRQGSFTCFQCQGNSGNIVMDTTGFYCTDFSEKEDWVQGERSFTYTFNTNKAQFGFSGGDWIPLAVQGGSSWEMRTSVDLHIRNDTGNINSSPTSAMPAIVRLEYGCNHTIKIPVYDPDKDIVRCRWAESSKRECAGVCHAFPHAFLDEQRCEITYEAIYSLGWYAIAIQIEDFDTIYSRDPLSSISLQFLAQVFNSGKSCQAKPYFHYPSPNDGECVSVPLNTTWNKQIVVQSGAEGVSINEINTISPPGMLKSSLEQRANYSRQWYVNVTWTPTDRQAGVHVFCFTAIDSDGMSSEKRCIHLVAGVEPPSVISFPRNYTIQQDQNNLTIYFDSQFVRPNRPAEINIYKSNGIFVSRFDAQDNHYVHYPKQYNDSSSWFLTVSLTNLTLEGNTDYYVTMNQGVAKGLEGCGGESPAMYNRSVLHFNVTGGTAIRLVGGRYGWEGRVEVYHNGEWGTVCDDYFHYYEAVIVCRMLGFSNQSVHYFDQAYYGQGNGLIWMRFFSCSGDERDITGCMTGSWNPGGCSHGEDVGVSCGTRYSSGTSSVFGGQTLSLYSSPVRLVGGNFGWEGRVEVLHNNRWGTICDDYFDKNDGDVICKMLGYSSSSTVWQSAWFGQGRGQIWLDNLNCSGFEISIDQCSSNGWGRHDCTHPEDASVRCNIEGFLKQTTVTSLEQTTIQCYNGGYSSGSFGFQYCHCRYGYTGTYCEYSVITYSPCHSYPCYNGGTCYPRSFGYPGYYCSCPSGYTGQDCLQYVYQTTYDPCYSHPCHNGGTCHTRQFTYFCTCPVGYSGRNCGNLYAESAVHVACADNSWNIRLYLPQLYGQYADFDPYDVYLGQDRCTGTVNGNYLLFQLDYTRCNTVMKTSLDNIIYNNKLIYALHDPNHHFIVREYRFQMDVNCYIQRSEGNSGHFNHGHDVTSSVQLNGSAHHTVHLQFFTDSSFTQIKPLYGSRVGDTVYVKATANVRDYNVKMRLSDCFTTPTSNSDPSLRYFIIRNGCVIDPNARILSQSTHETRFYFQDFEYSTNHDSLYIYCNATFCKSNDYSSRCEQACHHYNLKRIGGGNIIKEGPFDVAEVNQAVRMSKEKSHDGSSSIAVSVISVGAVILLVVLVTALATGIVLKRRRNRKFEI